MPLYGQFARHARMKISFPGLIFAKYKSIILILQSEDQRNDETWTWLKEGKLKRETVSYCCSTRSSNKNKLCKSNNRQDTQTDPKECANKTTRPSAILYVRSQNWHKRNIPKRHDNIAKAIHWDLSGKYAF